MRNHTFGKKEDGDQVKSGSRKCNAWKRYGAFAMAGVLFVGSAAGLQGQSRARAEEETEQRITLNIAGEHEEETEAGQEESESESETESETETETETETEKETFAPIDTVSTGGATIVTTDVSEIVEACMPSIVSITERSVQEVETYYYGVQEYESIGSASGVIVAQNDDELLIATNSHVVADTQELTVGFTAEAENEEDLVVAAKIKGTDTKHELAVVAVQLSDIPKQVLSQLRIATLGSSDELKVGQAAIAIGNALGYGQSVTSGIISALNKEVNINDYSDKLIQTDAAINLGNSGGALLNAQGEVIGINVAKAVGDNAENVGYAIPIDTAIPILEQLVNRQTRDKVEDKHGYLGITVINVSDDAKELYNMPAGAFVHEVTKGSAAEKAGIRQGDVITRFDGIEITSQDALVSLLEYYEVGETVKVEVQTANGGVYESREVEVCLQEGTSDTASSTPKEQPEQNQENNTPYMDDEGGFPFFPFFEDGDRIF